ncbi:MAG: MCE family protein, partial [Pseudomonadota bacterium]|nr:MCE family protein [Pseudomonadota bacterium]
PVGQVSEISLSEDDPEFVRVRVKVKEGIPILVGTTATIQSSFTGVSTILLDGARKNQPAITCETTACPEGRPVIPPKDGGINALLNSAPLLLERLATLTENLNLLLGPENQEEITAILRNTDRLTAGLADATPALKANLEEFQNTLTQFNETLASVEELTDSTNGLVNGEGKSLSAELRTTLKSATKAADTLAATLEETQPAARQLREGTLPAAEATMQDLRATSRALRSITEKLESEGVGSIIGGRALPDYKD